MDFDIDAVTLITYDVNELGMIELWSPYASISTIESFEASKKIPLPLNITLEIGKSNGLQEIKTDGTVDEITEYFEEFKDLFIFKVDNTGKLTSAKIKNPRYNRNSEELIKTLTKLFKRKDIYVPNEENQSLTTNILNSIRQITGKNVSLTHENVVLIFNNLVDTINNHNMYLTKVDNEKLRRIVNNSNMNSMYNIITDTINLSLSMTSVDTVTKPVKHLASTSAKAIEEYLNGPGNFNSFGVMIYNNYSGKDCIAKSASTLKCFFKVTHYNNKILNSGDPELQKYLNVNPEIYKYVKEFIPFLANVRPVDPTTVVNETVLNLLLRSNTINDLALNLSALLGLSADNAKELVLAKINSGIDMIGMYLYGISIGFSIEQLANLLMGETANIVLEIMASNVYDNNYGMKLTEVFDYLQWGPAKLFAELNKIIKEDDSTLLYKDKSPIIATIMLHILNACNGRVGLSKKYRGKKVNVAEQLLNSKEGLSKASSNQLALALVLVLEEYPLIGANDNIVGLVDIFDQVRNDLNKFYSNLPNHKIAINRALDFIEQYAYQFVRVNDRGERLNNLDKLKILAYGSSSMQRIGSIVGLNQGIPSKFDGFLNKINAIENYIILQAKDYFRLVNNDIASDDDIIKMFGVKNLNDLKIDISKFITDLEYRKKMIDLAEKVKINFNLLSVIDVMPDILNYVNGLYIENLLFKYKSAKYANIQSKVDDIKKESNIKLNTDVINLYSTYFLHGLITSFLKEISKSGFRFRTKSTVSLGITSTLNNPVTLSLSSASEIASFKYWMENEVIPELKAERSDNDFINALTGSTRNNTISGNEVTLYTLPINMMPKENSNEDLILKLYINSFNAITKPYKGHRVKDLFFLYSLIAFEWKPSQRSLVKIFEGSLSKKEGTLIELYYDFIGKIDAPIKNEDGVLEPNYLDFPELNYDLYFAAKNRYKNPNAERIYAFNPDTGLKSLYIKKEELSDDDNEYDPFNVDYGDYDSGFYEEDDEYDSQEPFSIPGYEELFIYDPNYYIFGHSNVTYVKPFTVEQINLDNSKVFKIERQEDRITRIKFNDKLVNMSEIKDFITVEDGKDVVNFKALESYLNNDKPENCS